MNPAPTMAALANSTGNPANATGSAAPIAMPLVPISIGRRIPTRSENRPAATASNIGSNAYSAISTPTVNGDAPIDSASSDTVTRLPESTAWFAIPSGIRIASVRESRPGPPVTVAALRAPSASAWGSLRPSSRRQPINRPEGRMRIAAAVTDAVVQPRRTALPEFELVGREPVPAPVRGARNVIAGPLVLRLYGREARLEVDASGDRLALRRCPCAQPRRARPACEVRRLFGFVDPVDQTLDTDLALELGPEEEQRRVRTGGKIAPFATQVIGEEDEATLVEALEQHDPRRRSAVGAGRCQRHRIGLRHLRFHRFVEPVLELPERIGRDIALVERFAHVIGAQVGDLHGAFATATLYGVEQRHSTARGLKDAAIHAPDPIALRPQQREQASLAVQMQRADRDEHATAAQRNEQPMRHKDRAIVDDAPRELREGCREFGMEPSRLCVERCEPCEVPVEPRGDDFLVVAREGLPVRQNHPDQRDLRRQGDRIERGELLLG